MMETAVLAQIQSLYKTTGLPALVYKADGSLIWQNAVSSAMGDTSVKVKALPAGHGFDAAKCQYVDMIASGIVDPAKVTRSALQNAASIAALILTTETLVTDVVEEEKKSEGGHGSHCCC